MRVFSFLVLLFTFTFSVVAQEESTSYRIIGYYSSWSIYARQYFVTDIPADKLTHINYAFVNISEDGECILGDEWADTQFPYPDETEGDGLLGNFHQLQLLKEKYPHVQTLISVGGWTWSRLFSDVAFTAEARQKFAASCITFMKHYGFDGIDLDWEYPAGGGNYGNIERSEDPENFILLLAEFRYQLNVQGENDGRYYPLTIAAPAGEATYKPIDWARVQEHLDWINVMAYDMAGSWSETTGLHSPLYNTSENSVEGGSADSALRAYLEAGVPSNKLVLGVPFYGRGWSLVKSENNGLHQPYQAIPKGTYDVGFFDYGDIATRYIGRYQRFWHEIAKVPWLYDPESDRMITYEDSESIAAKAAYVREHELGGIMFWELSSDERPGTLVSAIYEGLNAGE